MNTIAEFISGNFKGVRTTFALAGVSSGELTGEVIYNSLDMVILKQFENNITIYINPKTIMFFL